MLYKKILKFFPIFTIIVITFLAISKIFIKGLFPYPGDLLVSFNFPWSSGGWNGYNPWTTRKALFASDAIRQHLPWHNFTFTAIKNGIFPLWNPYSFSGTPHFANLQTFILNPFNTLFLLLPLFNAWVIFIILQIPLSIYFTYLFARSLGLRKASSLFAGASFIFSSYFFIWFELGIVGYSILWLPLILFSIQKFFEKFKYRYFFLLIIASVFCIFAGHIQTAIYVFLIALAFWTIKTSQVKNNSLKIKSLFLLFIWLILTFLSAAIQLLPSLELYVNSPLVKPFAKEAFDLGSIPFLHLISFFAPDFFGNPATNNFWAKSYGDGTPNIGTIPLLFAFFALVKHKKWEIKFFSIFALIFILFAAQSPLFLLIEKLSIPILNGTAPTRTIFVVCFSLSILAGFGLDTFTDEDKKSKFKFYKLLLIFFIVYILMFAATIILPKLLTPKELWLTRFSISKKNLVIPFFSLCAVPVAIFLEFVIKKTKQANFHIKIYLIIITTVLVGLYQFNKISPFSPKVDFFPDHPAITWLQQNASINRFHGDGGANFSTNFATYYHIFSAEGYSVFRIRRYAELISSQKDGIIPQKYTRADADLFTENENNEQRLLDLLGVKYILSKDDYARDAKIVTYARPNDNVNFAWQNGKFVIYERNDVLPRYFLSSNYIVAQNDQEILNKIYDISFDLHTIILEKPPNIKIENTQNAQVNLISYEANSVNFKTKSDKNTLLFLSDAYYPGWNAYIDSNKTPILRADYALRAVPIPQGNHSVIFKYEPNSFKYGLLLSVVGIMSVVALMTISKKKGKL